MIELHWQDKRIFLDADSIIAVVEAYNTYVYLSGIEDAFNVDETVEEVMNMVSEATFPYPSKV